MARSLVSINVEGDRHVARVLPFPAERLPDVVCLQEVFALCGDFNAPRDVSLA